MGNEANSRLSQVSTHKGQAHAIEFPLGLPWFENIFLTAHFPREIFQHILSVCAVKDFLTLFCINSIWNTSIRSSSLLQRRRLFIDEGRKLSESHLAAVLTTFNNDDKLLITGNFSQSHLLTFEGMRGSKKKLILAQIASYIPNKAATWTLPTGSIPRFFG